MQTSDRPAACVIAQQYSSATLVSIALSFQHEKVRRWSKKFACKFLLLFLKTNCLSVKLGNLNYRTSDIFCTEWLYKNLRIVSIWQETVYRRRLLRGPVKSSRAAAASGGSSKPPFQILALSPSLQNQTLTMETKSISETFVYVNYLRAVGVGGRGLNLLPFQTFFSPGAITPIGRLYRVRHKSVNTPLSYERLVVRTRLAVYSGWG